MAVIRGSSALRAAACAAFTFSLAAHASGGDAATMIGRLRGLDADIVATTRIVEAAHADAKAADAKTIAAIAAERRAFEMISRDASSSVTLAEANLARKRLAVGRLLVNLEHARDAAIGTPLPTLVPAAPPREKLMSVATAARAGRDCAHALTVASGHGIEATLADAGTDDSALWLRVAPSDAASYRVDTVASALDTDIALFGAACPASDAAATARGDDELGLASEVSFDARVDRSPRYVRIRNLGSTGHVIARVATGAAFSGRVTDERNGHAVSGFVRALMADGSDSGFAATIDDNGFYLVVVDPGSYYAYAVPYSNGGLLPEVFPDVECGLFQEDSCNLAAATLLTLTDDLQQPNINFALNVGGTVSGTVRDRDSGLPVRGAVQLSKPGSFGGYGVYTDEVGRYAVTGLPTGQYLEYAMADGYGSQVWLHIDCGGELQTDCNPDAGDLIPVTRDQTTRGIDFDLPRQASIRASVSLPGAAPYSYWNLGVYDLAGNYVASASGDSTSFPTAIVAVPPGEYRVIVDASGFFSQLWDGVDCPVSCTTQLADGSIVTVARGVEADVTFSLRRMPTISGTVRDVVTGEPVPNASVVGVYDTIYGLTSYTDSSGRYTLQSSSAGDYYVYAFGTNYQGSIYPTGTCTATTLDSCDMTHAIVLPIVFGGNDFAGIDLSLAPDGSISGHVAMRMPPGVLVDPIVPSYANVNFQDSNGLFGGSTNIDVEGSYTIALPAGTWYATATSSDAFEQAWNGIDCDSNGCDYRIGTPIAFAQGQALTGIDFDPVPLDYVFGRVIDASGGPVAGTIVDLWQAPSGVHCGVGLSNANGYYAAHDDNGFCGDHYVSTDVPNGYVNQVFDRVVCPDGPAYLGLCDVARGTVVEAPHRPAFLIANFNLGARVDAVFASGFDP